ncbi:hypothetical protein [Phreatobacter sp.]|uniref:hypothetical protein n=1 Tax=Phreatobacter sp. TaxID=1966341 RepID=UPI003F719AFB
MSPGTRRALRLATFLAATVGALFWLAAMVASLTTPPGPRDGHASFGLILATVYALVLVLPAFVLALLDRWPVVALLLGLAAVAIGLHAVVPWAPLGPLGS